MSVNCSLQLPYSQIYMMQNLTSQQSYQVFMPWTNVQIQPGQLITFGTPVGVSPVIRLQGSNVVTANDTVNVNPLTMSISSTGLTFDMLVNLDEGTSYYMTDGLLVNLLITLPVAFADTNPAIGLSALLGTTNFSSPPPLTIICTTHEHQLQGSNISASASVTYPSTTSVNWQTSGPLRRGKIANKFQFTQSVTTTVTSNPPPTGGTGLIPITIGTQPPAIS